MWLIYDMRLVPSLKLNTFMDKIIELLSENTWILVFADEGGGSSHNKGVPYRSSILINRCKIIEPNIIIVWAEMLSGQFFEIIALDLSLDWDLELGEGDVDVGPRIQHRLYKITHLQIMLLILQKVWDILLNEGLNSWLVED